MRAANRMQTDLSERHHDAMKIALEEPTVHGLSEVLDTLRGWQHDGAPVQLHPGDLGWFWRFGAPATAAATRTWRRSGEVIAVGLLDGRELLRLAIAPDALGSDELARQLVVDVTEPERGVLPPVEVYVESPTGALVHDLLGEQGWGVDEPWTLLRRDLREPVEVPAVRVAAIGPDRAQVWSAVTGAAFAARALPDELALRWQAMAAGLPYGDARCLVAYDDEGNAVAAATVWSAGPGRYGLLEPMGTHPEHRGHGFGKAITLGAAAALRELGSSCAVVGTLSSNVGAVATYSAAGFQQLPERRDRRRDALGGGGLSAVSHIDKP